MKTPTNPTAMITTPSRFLIAIASLALISCGPSVDMPKGTSKGFTSARLVQRGPGQSTTPSTTENQVNQMIQKSIANQFSAKGLTYGTAKAELAVAYMVIYQEPGMTARYDDYFGYGRDADPISNLAHERGIVGSERPDYFQRAGIIIDVIDTRTNKLIYRNFHAGDVVRNVSDSTRAARINFAVAQALQPFFAVN